jgi:hypothetical protein
VARQRDGHCGLPEQRQPELVPSDAGGHDERPPLDDDEVVARLQKNWDADVRAYDAVYDHILRMADELADGITKQFPESGQVVASIDARRQEAEGFRLLVFRSRRSR